MASLCIFSMWSWVDVTVKFLLIAISFVSLSTFTSNTMLMQLPREVQREHSSHIPFSTTTTLRKCRMLKRPTDWHGESKVAQTRRGHSSAFPLSSQSNGPHARSETAAQTKVRQLPTPADPEEICQQVTAYCADQRSHSNQTAGHPSLLSAEVGCGPI